MIRITINREQAERIRAGDVEVELVDDAGRRVVILNAPVQLGWSTGEIEDAKRRAAETRGGRSTAEVLDRLRASDE